MKILLTGATGFIGSRLLAKLVISHDIWALCRSIPKQPYPRVTWIRHDLSQMSLPDKLPTSVDAVIHLAQSPHYREFPEQACDVFAIGANATIQLLDWARRSGARQFIFASTGGLYGWSDRPVRETDSLIDDDSSLGFYFAVKRSGEILTRCYSNYFNTVILRLFFVYGSGQRHVMLIPRLVDSVREGRPISLQGQEGIQINPVHVSDTVAAIERCLVLTGSHIINIAGPRPLFLCQIADLIGQHVGHQPMFTIDNTKQPLHLVADIGRMSSLLLPPIIDPAEGIAELCSKAS